MAAQTKSKQPLIIKKGIAGRGVFAAKSFPKNSVIFKLQGIIIDHPTQTSVQIGKDLHIEDEIAGFLNHACTPSAHIDRQMHAVVSLRDINENEEITFDYSSNEDKLAAPFMCRCCGKMISEKN